MKRFSLAQVIFSVFCIVNLEGLPSRPCVVHGSATWEYEDRGEVRLCVEDRAILEWESFSLGANECVRIVQPSIEATVLIRITGALPSDLQGSISANGKVYFINEKGLILGEEGRVFAKDFFVSTVACNEASFIEGGDLVFQGDSLAAIEIRGEINTPEGKTQLFAHEIEAMGTIRAEKGRIALTSSPVSRGQVRIAEGALLEAPQGEICILAKEALLQNEGLFLASEGRIVISSGGSSPFYQMGRLDVSGPCAGTIALDVPELFQLGEILADSSLDRGGDIEIHTKGSYTDIERSKISACAPLRGGKVHLQTDSSFFSSGEIAASGEVGGEVLLFAERLTFAASRIDVSGTSQGGVIQIDPATSFVYLNPSTRFVADAKLKGDGGRIEIFSEKKTQCFGLLSANGVERGGFIEVSGKGEFFCSGQASAFAKEGEAGTVLFDPHDLIINDTLAIYPEFQLLDPHPDQGTLFGNQILILSNGNMVVTKPWANIAGATHAGAVYLYNGLTYGILSLITGSQNNDMIGGVSTSVTVAPQSNCGVVALTGNSNFVVRSPLWNNGSVYQAGAATWGNGSTGFKSQGPITQNNSLVGSIKEDSVSDQNYYSPNNGVIALTNGNYVVTSPMWNQARGAATFGNGATGATGPVSLSNSIVGVNGPDDVALNGVFALTNGNYIVASVGWNHSAGAVTWGNGVTGTSGQVSSTNSLVGQNPEDEIGDLVLPLKNGHYVAGSSSWSSATASGAGAVAWGDGTKGTFGPVTVANSIYGTNDSDSIGIGGIYALPSGHYVIVSYEWNTSRGAVTWGNGTGPMSTAVSSSNSIVGTAPRADPNDGDQVGSSGIVILTNGNYVISSPAWNYTTSPYAGAATWCSGTKATFGVVGPSNSIVGSHPYDQVSFTVDRASIFPLTNGNYVVGSPTWANGSINVAGAATFGNGATGTSCIVSAANSLVGSTGGDLVGSLITPLSNGNYVVGSPNWNNGSISSAGAASWGNGATGSAGPVSTSNSLYGTTMGDSVSSAGILALSNGRYVVSSPEWNNGAIGANYGAVTLCSGPTVGPVTAAMSWTCSIANSAVGSGGAVALTNGNYVIISPQWSDDAGAVTLAGGENGTTGIVSPSNSLFGNTNDALGSDGVYPLSNGNYLILSPQWNNGLSAITPVNGTNGSFLVDGTYGAVLSQNSIVPETYNTSDVFYSENQPCQSIVVGFLGEGAYSQGRVHVALQSPNQITYQTGQGQNMTIPAGFITQALNGGTSVTLQANNDIVLTLYSPLQVNKLGGAAGALTLSAGKSVYIGANIFTDGGNLSIIANAPTGVVVSDRTPGDAYLLVATGVTLNVGTGALSLSILNGADPSNHASAIIAIEKGASLSASGNGSISLFAENHSIQLSSCSLQTQNGSLSLTAGESLAVIDACTLKTTGSGALTIVVDNLHPNAPHSGTGYVNLANATLLSGGPLKIYSVSPDLNTLPTTINNAPIQPALQRGNIYYPNSPLSGTPYALYYKSTLSVRKKTR